MRRTRSFIIGASDGVAIGRVHGEFFGARRPAATMVIVAGLLDDRWLVEIDAYAEVASGEERSTRSSA